LSKDKHHEVCTPFKAGLNINLSEILVSFKRGSKGKKGYGTPPYQTVARPHKGTSGWWAIFNLKL